MKTKLILSALLCLSMLFSLSSCGSSSSSASGAGASASDAGSSPAEPESVLLVDDDYINASFLKVYEEDFVEGVFYLKIRVENKSDQEVWVALVDASVNSVSTLVMSGAPMVIQPGNSSETPFIISYNNLDITQLDQIEDITFKVQVKNNKDLSDMETTDFVTISPT